MAPHKDAIDMYNAGIALSTIWSRFYGAVLTPTGQTIEKWMRTFRAGRYRCHGPDGNKRKKMGKIRREILPVKKRWNGLWFSDPHLGKENSTC